MSLPSRYVPKGLSERDRAKQVKSIKEGKTRPKVNLPTKRSKWTAAAHKYFGGTPTLKQISQRTGVPEKGLREIIKKGEGAYFSSGSRPNVTPKQWGLARLYAVLFGSAGARRVDKNEIEKYNIPLLKGGGMDEEPQNEIVGGDPMLVQKDYPVNYSNTIEKIISMISLGGDAEVMGSFSLRSQQYASDVDLYEIYNTKNITEAINRFKKIVSDLIKASDIYIGDIKIGEVPEWEIIPEHLEHEDYDPVPMREKVDKLYEDNIITGEEREIYISLLKPKVSIIDFYDIKKELRPHVLRWKPRDVMNGVLNYRGHSFNLAYAVQSQGLFKLDVVAYLPDKLFTEFSIIYDIRLKGVRQSMKPVDTQKTLIQDIEFYSSIGDYFKAMKRAFSLASYRLKFVKGDDNTQQLQIIDQLGETLNSDLGRLNQVCTNIVTLIFIIENHEAPPHKIRAELDRLVNNLANVYSVEPLLQKEGSISHALKAIPITKSKDNLLKLLKNTYSTLYGMLNKETLSRMA